MIDTGLWRKYFDAGVRPSSKEAIALLDEIDRLRERCEAYKGEIEAGAAEIERLREALTEIDRQYENQNINHVDFRVSAKLLALAALSPGRGKS